MEVDEKVKEVDGKVKVMKRPDDKKQEYLEFLSLTKYKSTTSKDSA